MDREIFEFLFSDLERVTEAFTQLILASGMSDKEIQETRDDKLVKKVLRKLTNKELAGNLSAISKFALVLVPIGLRINPEDITINEGLKYLPKIVEVNKDFFPGLLEALNLTSDEMVKIFNKMKPSPGKDSTQ